MIRIKPRTRPLQRLIGCRVEPDWVFSSPEDCRCLWLIQPDTPARLLPTLWARMTHRNKITSVIILCPDTHPFRPILQTWCNEVPSRCCGILTGKINTLLLLRDHAHKHTQSAGVHLTAFWIRGATNTLVSTIDVTSHVGTQVLTIEATFYPPIPGTCLRCNKPQLRDEFWTQWNTVTAEACAAHRWFQHKWVAHLNAMNQLLCTLREPAV